MKQIHVETIRGVELETVYDMNEVPFFEIMMAAKSSKRRGVSYLEIPAAFDIETTNMYQRTKNGQIDSDGFRPYSFMYHWQFCIGEYVIFGRRWEEFTALLTYMSEEMNLNNKNRLVVHVHNLNFEFAHMRKFLHVTEGFYKDINKPVRVLIAEGIEFRDSYILSNMSLSKFCENEEGVVHYKLSGEDYDYNKIRTAATPMTEKEEAYCYNDVRGLAECIASRMRFDTLATMPMTSTGYVRRMFRESMRKNPENRKIFKNAEYDVHMYELLRKAFRGGDTHANVRAANQILPDVQSFDIASSYPAVMVTEEFPLGKFTRISVKLWKAGYCEKHHMAYLIRCRFWDIKFKGIHGDPYIPFSQCVAIRNHHDELENANVYDNGRIIYAQAIEIVLTDVDWKIIQKSYGWSSMAVKEVYASAYGKLPKEFRDVVIDLFHQKTELKGVAGKEYEYMRSKNRINAAFGMTVQKVIEDETTYEDGEYETIHLDIAEQLKKYFKNYNNFLLYQWGVWVTAPARQKLHRGIELVGRNGIYWDTDSVKTLGDYREAFDQLNEEYKQKAIDAGAYATDPKGRVHYMGVFEYEETYKRFITLGAKKYLIEDQAGQLHSTIAGVAKDRGRAFFQKNGMEAFKVGTVIEDSGHLVAYYNNDDIHEITVEGCTMTTASNIALVDDTYTLGVTGEYADLLNKVLNNTYDMIYTD